MSRSPSKIAFEMLTAEDDGRVCKDIPESACRDQPQNFVSHLAALSFSKTADGLVDAKLVLSWLLVTLGSPAIFLGLLVPVREAGALLPQLFTAAFLRSLSIRKWAWALGSLVQGCCAIGMAVAAFYLEGAMLGAAILALVCCLALARSVCSVSYKDVLGKTLDKSKRGTATGAASSVAAGLIICYALILASNLFEKKIVVMTGFVFAGLFWIFAALIFSKLTEEEGAVEGGGNAFQVAKENFTYLRTDRQLRLFILTRALLIATALAPPFMILLSTVANESNYGQLGLLVFASSAAGLLSSYFWGRLADRSSRKVLLFSGLIAGSVLLMTCFAANAELFSSVWLMPLLIFGLMLAHQGVRLGRATHLVDMADPQTRAAYTALSNTTIGILLLLASGFGLLANYFGEIVVIAVFATLSFLGAAGAYQLDEVQTD